jgi:hypothetical protein
MCRCLRWPPAKITYRRRGEWDAFEGLDSLVDDALHIAAIHADDGGLRLRECDDPLTRCRREQH